MHDGFVVVERHPEPGTLRAWTDFLGRADYPSHYVSPDFFQEPFVQGRWPFAVLARLGQEIIGVATGVRWGGRLECGLQARPEVAVVPDAAGEAQSLLAQGLLHVGTNSELISVFSWTPLEGFEEYGFRTRQLSEVAMLDLTVGSEALMRGIPASRRRNIRKATRSGVEVTEFHAEADFDEYFAIYLAWCRRKRNYPYPRAVIREAFERKDLRRILLARYQGKIIAGLIARTHPNIIEYGANHSLSDYLHLRPNDLLHWRLIEWACEQGYRYYKLGMTQFARRGFGATLVPTYRLRVDRTFLRRHDRGEFIRDWVRSAVHLLPQRLIGVFRPAT